MRLLTCLLIVLRSATAMAGPDPQAQFARAAASYDAGQFNVARAQYDSLLESGYRAPQVYFNLGNALFRAGSLGHAIWAYRSALELAPRDPDIVANLTVARLATRDRIEASPPGFLQEVWRTASSILSLAEGARLVTFLWFALWFFVALLLWLSGWRRWVMPFVRVLALAWVVSAATLSLRYLAIRNTQTGVVIASESQARSAPDADEDVVFTGHAGMECVVRGSRGEFSLIELANGRVGWVPAADLKLIDP